MRSGSGAARCGSGRSSSSGLGRGRGAEREAWHPLSQREFEVARQVAAGLTNGEIADELGVSPKTVSAHVEHILAKLGVSRRAEIAAWVAVVARQDTTARRYATARQDAAPPGRGEATAAL